MQKPITNNWRTLKQSLTENYSRNKIIYASNNIQIFLVCLVIANLSCHYTM